MDWQPITTAPNEDDAYALVAWSDFDVCECEVGWRKSGVWVDRCGEKLSPQPTHWMPLPPLPQDAA
jgi:hypothetical protein